MFNWSDLLQYNNLHFEKGITNDYFYFIVQRDNLPIQELTINLDPYFGNDNLESGDEMIITFISSTEKIAMYEISCDTDCTVDDITVALKENNLANNIGWINIPDELNTIATYPIASVTTSENLKMSQLFIDFVLSPQGQQILESFHFIPAVN